MDRSSWTKDFRTEGRRKRRRVPYSNRISPTGWNQDASRNGDDLQLIAKFVSVARPALWLLRFGIVHERTLPNSPYQNGKRETSRSGFGSVEASPERGRSQDATRS
jgi:hypothetical protein